MPSLECLHAAHRVAPTRSVQSNVYAPSAGNDMPLILYVRIAFATEKAESIASLFLRHAKRGIRVLDQHFGIFSISGKDAYSDARAHIDFLPRYVKRMRQRGQGLLRNMGGISV
jgi:hypothetical protein